VLLGSGSPARPKTPLIGCVHMAIDSTIWRRKREWSDVTMASEKRAGLAISQLDLEKRYDIYHCVPHEERLYEKVAIKMELGTAGKAAI
jgi:hypothetical protein